MTLLFKIRTLLATALLVLCGVISAHAAITEVNVFTSGTEGYNKYRIPTIVKAANGDLLAFAEARDGGDTSDIDIVMKRSIDSGATWGSLQLVKDNEDFGSFLPLGGLFTDITVGNQSPVVDLLDPVHPGRIWMPFTLENDLVFVTYSDDHGATWSNHTQITSTVKDSSWGWYATGPVHGIQLERGAHAGRLIIPSDHRADELGFTTHGAHVLYSDDHGQTWELGAVDTHTDSLSDSSPNENVAVELVDERVYFNARNQNGSNPSTRSINYSSDGGLTYDGLFTNETAITTPKVQNSALRFHATDQGDADNIILYSSPGKSGAREDLTILTSLDETNTWAQETLIHAGPSAYSDLVKLSDDSFGVLFEAGNSLYDEILFATMDYSDLANTGWNNIVGDVNQNGVFNAEDLDAFVTAWTGNAVDTENTRLQYQQGDLNLDGFNDIFDVQLMRTALKTIGAGSGALSNLGKPVPEPTTVFLIFAILTMSMLQCRRPFHLKAQSFSMEH